MSRLIVMSKNSPGRQVTLRQRAAMTIGRADRCDVVIASVHASRAHAEVLADGDSAMLRDLGSSNGTFVNGRRIQQHQLRHGDVLSVGGCDIRFLMSVRLGPSSDLPALSHRVVQQAKGSAIS